MTEQEKQKKMDQQKLKRFVQAFQKLKQKYPEVMIYGDVSGDIQACITRSTDYTRVRISQICIS